MRDPERIPRILDKLSRLWYASPDLRFGQLVENVMHSAYVDPFEGYRHDCIYQVEDSVSEKYLDSALSTHGNPE